MGKQQKGGGRHRGGLDILLILVLLGLSSPSLYSRGEGKNTYAVEIGPDLTLGHTRYQIGGTYIDPDGTRYLYWFPLSELNFPLNVFWLNGGIKADFSGKVLIRGTVKKTVTSYAGFMADSDWGIVTYDPSSLDVYSESDAELDGLILEGELLVKTYTSERYSLYGGIGFTYRNFQYVVSNLSQESVDPAYEATVEGKVLTYGVEYFIPYAVLQMPLTLGRRLTLLPRLGISPYVIVRDMDDHILRYKKSTGEATGMAFIAALRMEYPLNRHFSLSGNLDYSYIGADGWQEQYQYEDYGSTPAGSLGKIRNSVESSLFSFTIGGAYRF